MELETMEYLRRESAKTHLHIFHVTPVSSVKTKLISRLPLPVEMNRHIYTFLNGSRTIRHVPYIYSKKYKEREDRILSNSLLFVGNERNSCFVRAIWNEKKTCMKYNNMHISIRKFGFGPPPTPSPFGIIHRSFVMKYLGNKKFISDCVKLPLMNK